MALDKDKIKESLTPQEIKEILNDLGSKDPIQGNQYQTVCHGGNKHKLYYYDESKMFHCYTDCGCNFDVFELVIQAKKNQGRSLTFPEAVYYVANLTGRHYSKNNRFTQEENYLIDDWDWLNKFKRKEKIQVDLPTYSEKIIDVFLSYPHEEWLDDGISSETMQQFNIGYYQRENKITIPHYDIHNRLVGIRGRALNQEDIDSGKKYMPLSIEKKLMNHPLMFNWYGLHRTQDAIRRVKKCAIFEGEKSVLKCEDYYGEDNFSVAACGSNISDWQRDMILSLGVEEVIIMFDKYSQYDNEEKIERYQEKLLRLARKFTPYCVTSIVWDDFDILGYKESPVDRGKEKLELLMKNKYEIKTINEVEQCATN